MSRSTKCPTRYRMLPARMLEPGPATVIISLPDATIRGTVDRVERGWTETVRVRFTSGAELIVPESAMVGLIDRDVHGRPAASVDLPTPTPDASDTIPDGIEYLGSYSSVSSYMRAMLEPEVTPTCAWILDHLDYQAVQRRWESDGSRLMIERGHVYRLSTPESHDDSPGPWMPTRGE